ncbi:glucose 1-dehydrogenase [Novosphingobium resinovorum]|uniref:SDR family NAD(P)-dependent oxidoreductase n=1 Tax=Novosphingobium resinovorum TaxID=158500 RepID=UPI002ED3A8ED|nr:glucose 1-dehydrogenase [Novosphingobium resinovorum]
MTSETSISASYSATSRGAAIVTGGSGGIGSAIARSLAAGGHAVVVHANGNLAAAQALAEEIEAGGGQALALAADVTDPAAVEAMVAEATARFGGVAVLVNNAGICTSAPVGGMDAGMIDRELAVNVKSVVLVTQACLPHMAAGAAVVNVSSNIAFSPLPGMTLYCAAKAAVASLTQGFAKELGARGIRVNAVAPGATRTAMTAWIDDATEAAIGGQTPLGRIGEPMDIAGAVAFLASPEASWITGRTLVIDGGLT